MNVFFGVANSTTSPHDTANARVSRLHSCRWLTCGVPPTCWRCNATINRRQGSKAMQRQPMPRPADTATTETIGHSALRGQAVQQLFHLVKRAQATGGFVGLICPPGKQFRGGHHAGVHQALENGCQEACAHNTSSHNSKAR